MINWGNFFYWNYFWLFISILTCLQSQLVQGHSHSRLNVSPLKEVSSKVEDAASGGHKTQTIILSPAELLKPRTPGVTPPKTPTTGSKQASPAPDYIVHESSSSLSKVINIFRGRSASSATAEDKKQFLQKVSKKHQLASYLHTYIHKTT